MKRKSPDPDQHRIYHIGTEINSITTGFSLLLSDPEIVSVTVFDNPLSSVKSRVRLTRNMYKRGRNDIRDGSVTVSIGRPNYREREYLMTCRKAKCNPRRYWISKREK